MPKRQIIFTSVASLAWPYADQIRVVDTKLAKMARLAGVANGHQKHEDNNRRRVRVDRSTQLASGLFSSNYAGKRKNVCRALSPYPLVSAIYFMRVFIA